VAINGRREDAQAEASGHACTSFEAAPEEQSDATSSPRWRIN
jgi:hypothetical protein